jgi:hypothetical protein
VSKAVTNWLNIMAFPNMNWAVGLFALSLLTAGCSRSPHLVENDELSNQHAGSAPLVVVGVIDSDKRIRGGIPSRRDPAYPMQLRQAKVRIENVLRGSMADRTVLVYYFGFDGGFDGPRPLGFWRSPSRRVLWMRRDGDIFRLACDGWDKCTMPVESGSHPQYQVDLQKTLNYAVVDVLLTRGEGVIDERLFASEIEWGVPDQGVQGHVIERLGHLALTEPAAIKATACVQLWIYAHDRIENSLRRNAENSLRVANCVCKAQPNGNVKCE